jgi:hypothetical protein
MRFRGAQGDAGQHVTRHGDACKNFICLVPRSDNGVVSRRRTRDYVETSVALDCAVTWLVVRITWWLIVIHFVEIAVWALFFWWQKSSAGCRVVVLLFRRHLRNDRLRGFGAAESVAFVRPSGGIDWRFDVWVVHGIFIRHFEQNVQRPEETQPRLIYKALGGQNSTALLPPRIQIN